MERRIICQYYFSILEPFIRRMRRLVTVLERARPQHFTKKQGTRELPREFPFYLFLIFTLPLGGRRTRMRRRTWTRRCPWCRTRSDTWRNARRDAWRHTRRNTRCDRWGGCYARCHSGTWRRRCARRYLVGMRSWGGRIAFAEVLSKESST